VRARQMLGVALSAALLAAGGVVLALATPAGALTTTIIVANNADTGAGSLRQAFIDASSGGVDQNNDVQIIVPAPVGQINLSSQLLYDGGATGAQPLTLSGGGNTVHQTVANRVIADVSTGLLTVSGLTITGGQDNGGGVNTSGSLTITNVQISGNSGVTGGVLVGGSLTMTNSTISGNTSSNAGGAAGAEADGSATVINSTISGNSAPTGFGGITANTVTLVYATITDNTGVSTANVRAATGTFDSFGSVVASPHLGPNCANAATSHGFNLEDDAAATCGFSTATADLAPGTNPNLGSLAANGGPTQTLLPQAGSALIDAIPSAHCGDGNTLAGFTITTDQRGLPRPDSASPNCDIGAVEVQPPAPPTASTLTAAFTG
jgi:Right handed beta helix region